MGGEIGVCFILGPHDPARILGGKSDCIQHIIALGHWNKSTPSGGPLVSVD